MDLERLGWRKQTPHSPQSFFVRFYRDMNKAERDTEHERHTVVLGFDLIFSYLGDMCGTGGGCVNQGTLETIVRLKTAQQQQLNLCPDLFPLMHLVE